MLSFADEPQKNGKTIRWCQVDVGEAEPRGIVCGAHNFAEGDLVVVSLPGAVLPGGFAISARKTYGHISDGMICSVRELGIGDDHEGILVLAPDAGAPGDDAVAVLGLGEAVLDVAVTTDRGYCLSIRGLAREAAAALDGQFHDVVGVPCPKRTARPTRCTSTTRRGCDRFSARTVEGLDPSAPSPAWLAARLQQCGIRSISLAVDVTNYVMLETGQPLHAFDRARLAGALGVRRARPGEKLTTLDGVARTLDPDDLVVTDDSGPIALAGVMGGASTEIGARTEAIVLEAAHWEPGADRAHRPTAQAAQRGLAAFRTRRRPGDRRRRAAALRGPAGRVRRSACGRRLHRGRHARAAEADRAARRSRGTYGRPAHRDGHGRRHARGGGLHGDG